MKKRKKLIYQHSQHFVLTQISLKMIHVCKFYLIDSCLSVLFLKKTLRHSVMSSMYLETRYVLK